MSLQVCALSFVLLVTFALAVPLSKKVDVSENKVPESQDTDGYRLERNVVPSHYKIELEPNIAVGDFTFKGQSIIDIDVVNKTKEIVLHAKDLEIDNRSLTLLGDNNTTKDLVITTAFDKKKDFLKLQLSREIPGGKYKLNLTYTGLLHDDLNGFYRSSYIDHQGQEVWLATTQFEPTWARRAFPCFDEPGFKATFDISIQHFENYTAVSNMKAKSLTRPNDGSRKWLTTFEVTPVMSTYLVAFVVSDFKYLASDDQEFRVYSRYNAIQTGKYALGIGQKQLNLLEQYTGIPLATKKMDNFAIPQFRAGAMENWGIVTYRESGLLFEENVTTTESKQAIATVISHEFAHQWFGNLVSPLWWDYTWLNEGFANYFQYLITHQAEPTWRMMDQFVIKNLQETSFGADDNVIQHAMDTTVNTPDEISKNFDSITYSKAGTVIRMFSHVLGESVFQNGLRKYLSKNKYTAVTSKDLFDALAEVGKPVVDTTLDLGKVLESWVKQPGYPVVTVTRNHTTGTATISQKRFLTNTTKASGETWFVPINYVTEDKPDFKELKPMKWLLNDNKTISISGLKINNWVIFNKQQTGYYRVNYDPQNWKLIAEYLKSSNNTKIHVLNRAQLLDDSFKLAQAGELKDHTAFLEISKYLQNEDDYVPWYAAYRAFSVLTQALANTDNYYLVQLYIRRLTEKIEKTVGYSETEEDDHIKKFNRLNAVKLACSMGSPECLSATHDRLVQHVTGLNKTSADLRNVVLCAGIRTANATIWEKSYNFTATLSKDSSERSVLVAALGCSSDANILKSYLKKTLLVESKFSRMDVVKAVYSGSAAGIDIALDFIIEHFKFIVDTDGNTASVLSYLNEIGKRLTTANQINKLETFVKALHEDKKDFADALRANAVASANNNIKWLKNYEPQISAFLIAQKLVDEKAPVTDKPSSSNISLPSISLTTFMIIVAALIKRFN